jgi:hypothetical protein
MAEEKEEGGGKGWGISTELEIFIVIVAIIIFAIISGFFSHFAAFFGPLTDIFTGHTTQAEDGLKTLLGSIVGLTIPVDVMLVIGIVLSVERLKKIRRKEHDIYYAHVEDAYVTIAAAASGTQVDPNHENVQRWRKILAMVDSTNQNDWRQAIIESDIILDEILSRANYPGMDLGSKIRSATSADFKTVDMAGEAHGVRNKIAHDGINFPLSQHEAKRVINLYRQVFEEFLFI